MGSKIWLYYKREISLLAIFAFLYQLILIPRAALFGFTGGVFGLISGIAIMFAGYVISGFITKKQQNFYSMLIAYLIGIVSAVLVSIIYLKIGPSPIFKETQFTNMLNWKFIQQLKVTFEGLAFFILYFVGTRAKFSHYDSIISRNKLIFGAIIFISAIIFIERYGDLAYLKGTVYTFSYIFIGLSLLLKNQENLDEAFIKKHIDLTTIPKNIRNYNTTIVMVIFTAILIIFNIKGLVNLIVTIISNTPRVIILSFLWILDLISRLLPGGEGGSGEGQGGNPDMSGLPAGEENAILAIITKVFFGAIIALAGLFVIWKLPSLFVAIGRKLKNIWIRILNVLKKLFEIQKENTEKEVDYVDEIIMVKPANQSKQEKEPEKKIERMGGRLWKNADYIKKIRFMYGLLVTYLKKSGIDIKRSDTTGSIFSKTIEHQGIQESMEFTTNVYDKARYGGEIPGEEEYIEFEEKFSHTLEVLKKESKTKNM